MWRTWWRNCGESRTNCFAPVSSRNVFCGPFRICAGRIRKTERGKTDCLRNYANTLTRKKRSAKPTTRTDRLKAEPHQMRKSLYGWIRNLKFIMAHKNSGSADPELLDSSLSHGRRSAHQRGKGPMGHIHVELRNHFIRGMHRQDRYAEDISIDTKLAIY